MQPPCAAALAVQSAWRRCVARRRVRVLLTDARAADQRWAALEDAFAADTAADTDTDSDPAAAALALAEEDGRDAVSWEAAASLHAVVAAERPAAAAAAEAAARAVLARDGHVGLCALGLEGECAALMMDERRLAERARVSLLRERGVLLATAARVWRNREAVYREGLQQEEAVEREGLLVRRLHLHRIEGRHAALKLPLVGGGPVQAALGLLAEDEAYRRFRLRSEETAAFDLGALARADAFAALAGTEGARLEAAAAARRAEAGAEEAAAFCAVRGAFSEALNTLLFGGSSPELLRGLVVADESVRRGAAAEAEAAERAEVLRLEGRRLRQIRTWREEAAEDGARAAVTEEEASARAVAEAERRQLAEDYEAFAAAAEARRVDEVRTEAVVAASWESISALFLCEVRGRCDVDKEQMLVWQSVARTVRLQAAREGMRLPQLRRAMHGLPPATTAVAAAAAAASAQPPQSANGKPPAKFATGNGVAAARTMHLAAQDV